jgi:hypothetical protein
MRLIRMPHVFSFLASRSSGCVGACFTLCRATSVGLLGFAVLCGAILMGQVDAHAQARWPDGSDSESIRAFVNRSDTVVRSEGAVVAQFGTDKTTCAVITSTNPAAPCYYCPEKSRNNRCVSQSRSANITACNLNTDGACTPECKEDPDHWANRPVVPNNSTTTNASSGGGAACVFIGWANSPSQCCQDYCDGYCRRSGDCSPPPVSNGGGGAEIVVGTVCPQGYRLSDDGGRCVSTNPSCPRGYRFDGNGHCVVNQPSGSGPRCPTGQVLNAQGNCVSQQPVPPTCYQCVNFTGCCRTGCTSDGRCRS